MLLKSCCIYSTGVVSVVILIVAISLVVLHVFQNALYSKIKEEIVLRNGSDAFKVWENPPPPVYMHFYFFNVSNPSEVLKGERPAVVEVGPYTYRELRPMEEVNFLANGTKVSALNPKTYIFEANMSVGPEDDLIRTVNIPALTVMAKFKDHSIISGLISAFMRSKNEGLFMTRTVGELLWGYVDDLLQAVHALVPEIDVRFGLFYKMNGTDDGEYVFFTGKDNYKDFARISEWRGESSLNWWSTDECNMINGTNAASFHPIITKDEALYMFSSDLCRSIYAKYEQEVSVMGIPAFRFVPPRLVFANLTENPSNAGFCVPAGNCLGSGLLNVSACKQGAPIIMSSPHFYEADERFANDIYGMNPNKEDHETVIDINPLTGILLRAAKRLQVNVFVEKIPAFSQTGDVKTLVFPVMYLNEESKFPNICIPDISKECPVNIRKDFLKPWYFSGIHLKCVVIDEESAERVRAVVTKGNVVVNVPFILMAFGILLGVVFMLLLCRLRVPEASPAERQPLLASS